MPAAFPSTLESDPADRGAVLRRWAKRWLPVLVLLAIWWAFAAPAAIGGATTIVVVTGDSMEPLLQSGDVAVARSSTAYASGDLVVLRVNEGVVIHRIVSGSVAEGWRTQGDANEWVDPWVSDNAAILGTYAFALPGAGSVLTLPQAAPWTFAAIIALLTLGGAAIRSVLQSGGLDPSARAATRAAPASDPTRPIELALFATVTLAAALAVRAVLLSLPPVGASAGATDSGLLLSSLTASLATAAAITLGLRLALGTGVPEPGRSFRILHDVLGPATGAASQGEAVAVRTAGELRRLAQSERTAVVHSEAEGAHVFTFVSGSGRAHTWSAVSGDRR